ncbi:hypothetical protein [Paenibacillus caui]|uniref:hypothetical protein n=1 Tax=Paenibacillus caui TaxID=2873927 RepID=UPI001CAA143B|nr:hypothetical protein [Paenibacillus caui]
MRERRFLIGLVGAVVLLVAGGFHKPERASAAAGTRATWVWDASLIRSEPREIISFVSEHHVDVIYLQISRKLEISDYQAFIKLATAKNIKIMALDGDPEWIKPERCGQTDTLFEWLRSYQQASAKDERFSEIHLDIEPYRLDEWNKNKSKVIASWQSTVQYTTDQARSLNLPLSADLPFWLDQYRTADGKQTLSSWMIGKLDSVTIMSYRNSASGIYNAAAGELREAADLGKTIRLAVETNRSNEGAFISFYGKDAAVMERELGRLEQLAGSYSSFAGIAVHDYKGWKALKNH